MTPVEFDENNFARASFDTGAGGGSPALVRLIMKTGIVKDEQQANYVLIGIAVCSILLTLYVIKTSFFSSPPTKFASPKRPVAPLGEPSNNSRF